MNMTLLSNRELVDYQNEDSFDFLIKANAIKLFLENNPSSLTTNKMIVLYGEWGSGKTSLMKHIESSIDKDIFYPIFFHAWEHEKDENLPLSLCDALISQIDNDDLIKDFIKGAIQTLKSFTSGITIKTPGYLSGLGLDVEFSGEKYMKAIDDALKKRDTLSFYKSNKEFKKNFNRIEDLILEKTGATRILVFIDDLDRCEPENVLNLITALKLFFTYGEKTVFFSGIDKEAVTKAVKTRYKDVIKSEEYMEKVFDIAFNMPRTFSIKKILAPHFLDFNITLNTAAVINSLDFLEDFFKSIKFTNPRHLKKILNKYQIINSFKALPNAAEITSLIPDIVQTGKPGNLLETVYALFTIILYEFYPVEFEDVENYRQKMIKYTDIYYEWRVQRVSNYNKNQAANDISNLIQISDTEKATFNQIMNTSVFQGGNSYGLSKFIFIFSTSTPSSLYYLLDHELFQYQQHFTNDDIATNFCKFLIKYSDIIRDEGHKSDYIIFNIFNMVKYLL